VLVVGIGLIGDSLVNNVIAKWRGAPGASKTRLVITIVDPQADGWKDSIMRRSSGLDKHCEIRAIAVDVDRPVFVEDEDIAGIDFNSVSIAYICLADDASSVSVAIALHRRMRETNRRIPIVVPMSEDTGLTRLLPGRANDDGEFGNITAFGIFEQSITAKLLYGGVYRNIAHAIHEEYVRNEEKRGQTPETNPSMRPWDELDELSQKANFDQAVVIFDRLRRFGYDIVPLGTRKPTPVEFARDEIERMAKEEHDRWWDDKQKDGFEYGPEKKGNKHPYMVDWDQLSKDVKDKDREAVRAAPKILAGAGFQVVKRGDR
jgi:hypothetical protein